MFNEMKTVTTCRIEKQRNTSKLLEVNINLLRQTNKFINERKKEKTVTE